MMEEMYLSLGSNLGDRVNHLEEALGHITDQVGKLVSVSGIYESKAWGFSSEYSFCNCCVSVQTDLEPLPVLETILKIEKGMGRERNPPGEAGIGYTDRIIDIDLLLFGDLLFDHPGLVLPHPAIAERRFVLLPLSEIAPTLVHPLTGISISQMLDLCTDQGEVWPYQPE